MTLPDITVEYIVEKQCAFCGVPATDEYEIDPGVKVPKSGGALKNVRRVVLCPKHAALLGERQKRKRAASEGQLTLWGGSSGSV